ncbi:hypothetical protein AAVH_25858, partial [Aphelenchoides avenae]
KFWNDTDTEPHENDFFHKAFRKYGPRPDFQRLFDTCSDLHNNAFGTRKNPAIRNTLPRGPAPIPTTLKKSVMKSLGKSVPPEPHAIHGNETHPVDPHTECAGFAMGLPFCLDKDMHVSCILNNYGPNGFVRKVSKEVFHRLLEAHFDCHNTHCLRIVIKQMDMEAEDFSIFADYHRLQTINGDFLFDFEGPVRMEIDSLEHSYPKTFEFRRGPEGKCGREFFGRKKKQVSPYEL